MSELAMTSKALEFYPRVAGRCPACSARSLFLGEGGYVTCSRRPCPDPSAASDLLERSY